jgi:nitroreductase
MDVKEAIIKRRSIRSFQDIPIPRDVLVDILVAGQYAPNAGNLQNWRFIIVDDEHLKDQVADYCHEQTWMKTAHVFIVIFMDFPKMKKFYAERGDTYCHQTAAAVAENMIIMAQSHGLSSCWVGAYNDEMVNQVLNAPPNFKAAVILPIGYANEKAPVPLKLELPAVVYRNNWGGRGRVVEDFLVLNDYLGMVHGAAHKTSRGFRSTMGVIRDKIKNKFKREK